LQQQAQAHMMMHGGRPSMVMPTPLMIPANGGLTLASNGATIVASPVVATPHPLNGMHMLSHDVNGNPTMTPGTAGAATNGSGIVFTGPGGLTPQQQQMLMAAAAANNGGGGNGAVVMQAPSAPQQQPGTPPSSTGNLLMMRPPGAPNGPQPQQMNAGVLNGFAGVPMNSNGFSSIAGQGILLSGGNAGGNVGNGGPMMMMGTGNVMGMTMGGVGGLGMMTGPGGLVAMPGMGMVMPVQGGGMIPQGIIRKD
ncbi:hypothetical protein HDU76_008425, partial [Blyttiomyces sp. JEL0837]